MKIFKGLFHNNIKLPYSIWALGFVSMFMDISSEAIHGLLPIFLVTVLGASRTSVGILEGVAEASVLVVKFFSGVISDYFRKRKLLVLLGYLIGTISKPLFAISQTVGFIFFARIFDRIGKGIRAAPRDALIADITPIHLRGQAYGLRQSLDTVGAFVGPIIAIFLMEVFNDFRLVFWLATVPGIIAVTILALGVREKDDKQEQLVSKSLNFSDFKKFHLKFWLVVFIGGMFNFARFSEAFVILRLADFGLSQNHAPLVLIIMNIVYALSAYPIGFLSDRIKREYFLGFGLVALVVANFILSISGGILLGFIGVAIWGLHLGLTQGVLSAMIADTCVKEMRGTAFGIYSVTGAITLLVSSIVAGIIWDKWGANVTFFFSGVIGVLSLLIFTLYLFKLKK